MNTIPKLFSKSILPVTTESALFVSPAQMIGVVLWIRVINSGIVSSSIKIGNGTTSEPVNVFLSKTIAAGDIYDEKIWLPFKNGDTIYGVSTAGNVTIFITGIVGK